MNAVAKVKEQPAPVATSESAAIIAVIERAALNPAVDVDKMERLYAMHEKAMERQARAAFAAALAEVQPKLPVIDERGGIKDRSGNVQSTYAKWEDIADAIRPVLHEHGFALTFRVVTTPKVAVTGVLTHRDGHFEETTMELPVDGSGSKNDVQAVGSSFSYGKRYTAIALLNITSRARQDRDDDANRAGNQPISADQVRTLDALIEGAGADRPAFLKYLGVTELADLPASKFKLALNGLNAKKRAAAQKQGAR